MPNTSETRVQTPKFPAGFDSVFRRATKVIDVACCLVWIVFVCNLAARPAYAYVDPGSGLLLIQILGTTIAGATFLIRKRIRQVFSIFAKKSKPVE